MCIGAQHSRKKCNQLLRDSLHLLSALGAAAGIPYLFVAYRMHRRKYFLNIFYSRCKFLNGGPTDESKQMQTLKGSCDASSSNH